MALIKLQFKPGVNRDQTNYSGEGGWWDGDKIRFFSGYPQKIGGWVKATPNTVLGVCRQMYNWVTSYSDNLLAVGTNRRLYLETGGVFQNITPIRVVLTSPDTDDCFATGFEGTGSITDVTLTISVVSFGTLQIGDEVTGAGVTAGTTIIAFGSGNGGTGTYVVSESQTVGSTTLTTDVSDLVTVNIIGHDAVAGAFVTFSGVTGPIGGIDAADFNQEFEIVTVPTADTFTIRVANPSTTAVSSGGGNAITASFEINPGGAIVIEGYGWGVGGWGLSPWGLTTGTPVFLPQQDWWFDNFDNDLVANVRNGPIYYWVRGTNPRPDFGSPAVLLSSLPGASDVPDEAMQILVSQNDKHLLAFGATPFGGGDLDPLLIRWADQDDPVDWTPTPTNSAGFLRVSRGSKIVRALPTRQEILVWTDSHLYTLQFLGTTDVFGVQEYADNISIIGPRAVASINNLTFWMGREKFYVYSGRVETLPCTVRNYVFLDLDFDQAQQVVCGTNEGYNEVWWFYPSKGSNINDKYVVYNHAERVWYFGTLERTAWLDSPLREYPQAMNLTNVIGGTSSLYNHESGVNDDDAPMQSYIESNNVDLADGDKFILTKRIIPDVGFDGSNLVENPAPTVVMELKPRNFPGSAYHGTVDDAQPVVESEIDRYTDQIFIRARARQMAVKIMSNDFGVQWQLGAPRLDGREDGKR